MKILNVLIAFVFSFAMGIIISLAAGSPEILGSCMTLPAVIGGISFTATITGALPLGILTMGYVQVDVNKTMSGSGGNKKSYIRFFLWDEVATPPSRDSKGITTTTDIVMKAGKYMSSLYVTESTVKINVKGDGDPDAKGIMQIIAFDHPGDTTEIKEFQFNMMNGNFGIIVESCDGSRKRLLGSPCAPLAMKFDTTDDKDKNNSVFTFESTQKGPHIAEYAGTLTLATVAGTASANASSIDVTNGEGQYQLTSGTVSAVVITTLANAVHNGVYTLLGSGGAYPSTVAGAGTTIYLNNSTTWTGLLGASLTIKCIKVGAGTIFYEQSRT